MCLSVLKLSLCMCVCGGGGVGGCVGVGVWVWMGVGVHAEVTEVPVTMSCLPKVSDRAATEGSKYFELGQQHHEFLTQNTCIDLAEELLTCTCPCMDL